jgi:hypothetical protein
MDPFGDRPIPCDGLPDSDTSRVIVDEIVESFTISAPAGTTGNWDAHIYTLPIDVLQATNGAVTPLACSQLQIGNPAIYLAATGSSGITGSASLGISNVFQATSGVPGKVFGIVNIDSFNTSGRPLAPGRGVTYTAPNASVCTSLVSAVTGKKRWIGGGYEIHDETAPQFKQGNLTQYCMPQAPAVMSAVADNLTTNLSAGSCFVPPGIAASGTGNGFFLGNNPQKEFKVFNTPPSTVAKAMLYPESRQWDAARGVYCVIRQDATRNDLSFSSDKPLAFTDGEYQISATSAASGVRPTVADSWSSPTFSITSPPGVPATTWCSQDVLNPSYVSLPIHTSGTMLTGLNLNSTFTVTVRNFWEIAPVTGDSSGTFVSLAKPSPPLDSRAIEYYQRAITRIPVGVPVDMNADGDFWDWCLKALEAAADPVGSLFGPVGKAAGSAASMGLKGLRLIRNKRDNKAEQVVNRLAKLDLSNFKPNLSPKALPQRRPPVPTEPLPPTPKKGAAVRRRKMTRPELVYRR